MQALKAASSGALSVPGGGADEPAVPGASAQLVRVSAAAQISAPASLRVLFT